MRRFGSIVAIHPEPLVMAKPLLPDALWDRIKPLLPPPPKPRRPDRPGRHRLDDRRALIGILFVLKTGINWEDLPMEMGCGSGMTCWRRLAEWTVAGVWSRLHELLLAELEYAGKIDWPGAAARRPAPARWTVARGEASTTSSWTAAGRRWRRP